MHSNLFLSISGLMGAGKSTFTAAYSAHRGLYPLIEPSDTNPILPLYYKDPLEWAFTMQIYLLNIRYSMYKTALYKRRTGRGAILDRSIFEDRCFLMVQHKMKYISDIQLSTYDDLFANMVETLKFPDLLVHLDVTPETAFYRMNTLRKRKCEDGVPLTYVQDLHAEYERMLEDISRYVPILRVDYNEFLPLDKMDELISDKLKSIGFKKTG